MPAELLVGGSEVAEEKEEEEEEQEEEVELLRANPCEGGDPADADGTEGTVPWAPLSAGVRLP